MSACTQHSNTILPWYLINQAIAVNLGIYSVCWLYVFRLATFRYVLSCVHRSHCTLFFVKLDVTDFSWLHSHTRARAHTHAHIHSYTRARARTHTHTHTYRLKVALTFRLNFACRIRRQKKACNDCGCPGALSKSNIAINDNLFLLQYCLTAGTK